MFKLVSADLDPLKRAMKALKPAGAEGFEGLLAVLLARISGHDFRLAKSGAQNGKDGASQSAIAFEAKRYDGPIPDDQVATKVFRVGAAATPPHLWILGATVEVSTQLVEVLTAGAERLGIGLLLLDWPDASAFPPLALACAMAPEESIGFLTRQGVSAPLVAEAALALGGLRNTEGFVEASGILTARLREPSLALPGGRAANQALLREAFGDRRKARLMLGQALAPGSDAALPTRDRPELTGQLRALVAEATNGEVVALLGREGHGKSWLFAQAWLEMDAPPLTAIIPSRALRSSTAFSQALAFVVGRFIEQTGDLETDAVRARWKSRIEAWPPRAAGEPPRFILFIDGLNETPEFEWPRWLAKLADFAADHGGVLVVSARQAYFDDRVRRELATPLKILPVPEWSRPELDEILREGGVDPEGLSEVVLDRLCNPRLLGIGFDLLAVGAITTFAELSVDRLLFEHIRIGAQDGVSPETVDQFVKRLASHAREITDRVRSQQPADRLVFDQTEPGRGGYELTPDLAAVVAEHFYRPLQEDATLYTLGEDGLSLALGFSLIKALQQSQRGGGDAREALGELIDPIAALDKTAEAVFSALVVASVDDRVSDKIRTALILGFLSLQNVDAGLVPAFVGVVRRVPAAALDALATMAVEDGGLPNRDWMAAALRDVRHDPRCWAVIAPRVKRWLRTYSLDPALSVFHRQSDDPGAYQGHLETSGVKLTEALGELSSQEQAWLQTLVRDDDVTPDALHRIAIELLPGMALAPFAEALYARAYSVCLHSSLSAESDYYRALIQFNRVDWAETRAALLAASASLLDDPCSSTARWARVEILRATSTIEDGAEEKALVEALTADQDPRWHQRWRLVEEYSPADPCDPAAEQVGDLRRALDQLEALEPDAVSNGRWMRREDHFLEDAGPALARFAPDKAIEAYRNVYRNILNRPPEANRIAVMSMRSDAAVFDEDILERLRALAIGLATPHSAYQPDRDSWLISQFALLMVLPHLDGEAQAELLSAMPPCGTYLTTLQRVYAPCTPERLERWAVAATTSGEESQIALMLAYARQPHITISPAVWSRIEPILAGPRSVLRSLALGVVATSGDDPHLEIFLATEWSAAALNAREDFYEVWFGSWALIRAAERGLIAPAEIVARVGARLLSAVAQRFGADVQAAITARLAEAVGVLLAADLPDRPPAVAQSGDGYADASFEPPRYSLLNESARTQDLEAFARALDQTDEEFQAAQRRAWEAFGTFESALSQEDARLAVENIGFEAADAFAAHDPAAAILVARVIVAAPARLLPGLANFGLMLAQAISAANPGLARDLFARLENETPYLRLVFGPARVSLAATALWRSARHPELDALRKTRLDRAATDHDLAQEAQAALDAGQGEVLEAYARDRLVQPRPVDVARGLMVLGFGAPSASADALLASYDGVQGLIGKAADAARFAYDRNRWALVWRDRMASAETPAEVWRYSLLMNKIIDGRSSLWPPVPPEAKARWGRLAATFRDRTKRRIERWKSKRENTLFGAKPPIDIFRADDVG